MNGVKGAIQKGKERFVTSVTKTQDKEKPVKQVFRTRIDTTENTQAKNR